MFHSEYDALEFIKENDIKFIRLAFCNAFGVQKNISILPSELQRAFQSGILIDAAAFNGLGGDKTPDLFLFPDYKTMTLLPWRPSHGAVVRFFCNIRHPDGTPFEMDGRAILKNAVAALKMLNINCIFGTECEFYLFKNDETGKTTAIPLDNGGYMDIAPKDKGENIRREICLTLEEMGIEPQSSHHENGPGQNEITFKCGDALTAADNVTTYKSVVEVLSSINGLTAKFEPMPIPDRAGNGFHINIQIECVQNANLNEIRSQFMAGIMQHIKEITLFLNPSFNSYKRFGTNKAPKRIVWSTENRGQLIRMPLHAQEAGLIKLRSADPLANPYLAFALLVYAGIDGIKNHLTPPAPFDVDRFMADAGYLESFDSLPESLAEAVAETTKSTFVKSVLPCEIISAYKGLIK